MDPYRILDLAVIVFSSLCFGFLWSHCLTGPIGFTKALISRVSASIWPPRQTTADKATNHPIHNEVLALISCPPCLATWAGLALWFCDRNGWGGWWFFACLCCPGGIYYMMLWSRSKIAVRTSGCPGGNCKDKTNTGPPSLTANERAGMEKADPHPGKRAWTTEGPVEV